MRTKRIGGYIPVIVVVGLFHSWTGIASAQVGSTAATDATPTADPSAPQGAASSNDIIVTARRREERLQDVPVSVTALSGAALVQRGISSLSDMTSIAPGLTVGSSAAVSKTALTLTVRGQTLGNLDAGLDPSVGVYVDGIYVARLYGVNTGFMDLANVQVLKGPQGTLFGRNSPGGAILINSNDPDFDGYSGHARFTMGSYGQRDLEGVFNAPLVDDLISLRVAVQRDRSDGWGRRSTAPFIGLNDDHSFSLRGKILITPAPNVRVVLSAFHNKQHNNLGVTQLRQTTPAFDAVVAARSGGTATSADFLNLPYNIATLSGFIQATPNLTFQSGGPPGEKSQTNQYSGDARWEINADNTLRLIAGYRKSTALARYDLDGTPYNIIDTVGGVDSRQYSSELQLTGNTLENTLLYTAGVYYFQEKTTDLNQRQNTKSYAGYVSTTYKFTPKFSATLGGRYSLDNKRPVAIGRIAPNDCGIPPILLDDPSVCAATFHRKDGVFVYTGSLEYKPANDILLYAKAAKGTRSGGFNVRTTAANPTAVTDRAQALALYAPFAPEKVLDYEIGLKSQFFDRRLTFNISAYYDDYAVIQRTATVLNPNGTFTARVSSSAQGKVYGAEVEASFAVTPEVMVGGTFDYTHAKYDEFFDLTATGVLDRTNEPFNLTPKFTYSAFASVQNHFETGVANARVDWTYTDDVSTAIAVIRPSSLPFLTQKAFGKLNARASVRFDNGVEFAIFGRNLTNKHTYASMVDLGIAIVGSQEAPREGGLEIAYHF
jgi:iron complex outermembrane receptor protein